MKRDMELVRTLLLKVEEMPIEAGHVVGIDWSDEFFEVAGYDRDTAIKHFELLMEAGFIAAPSSQGMTQFILTGLTWEGYEFIDSNPQSGSLEQDQGRYEGGRRLWLGFDDSASQGRRETAHH